MKSLLTIATLILSTNVFAAPYTIDLAHSELGFSVKHLMITNQKGKFAKFGGAFEFDEKTKLLKDINVEIEVPSLDTADKDRDGHLLNPDFFDSAKFPKMTFKSTKVVWDKKGNGLKIYGPLTIKDKTREVVLNATYNGSTSFNGVNKSSFSATTVINRKDFGMTWNKSLDQGGVAVGDEVKINLELEADQKKS